MAIEGQLREFGIEDIFQLLELSRKTGVLSIRSEKWSDEAEVRFQNGAIVAASRRRSPRRLGQQLLRAGKLTERELERALEEQRANPGQRLGQILLEMGSVAREELERQLRFQLEETVYDLMAWDEGQFRFEESPVTGSGDLEVHVRVESLLMEGARRIDEWARLESRIPNAEAVPWLAGGEDGAHGPLDLRPEEWEVLAEIDGEKDLRQIAAALGRSSFEVAKIVYGLVSTGVVEVRQQPVRISERELEEARQEAERLLSAGEFEAAARLAADLQVAYPDMADLALLEGHALMGQGRVRAATEAYARAVGLDPLSHVAHERLGFAAVRIGDFERAARAWSAFLRLTRDGEDRNRVARALSAIEVLSQVLAAEEQDHAVGGARPAVGDPVNSG